MAMIKVIVCEPGQKPRMTEMENSAEAFHAWVGGYLEAVRVTPTTIAYVNEEGLLKHLPFNRQLGPHTIVGNIVVVGVSGPNERSLTEKERKEVLKVLG